MESINNQGSRYASCWPFPNWPSQAISDLTAGAPRISRDLFTDLATHRDKSAYRLGSVVFHQHTDSEQGEMLDIVDGQQRNP